MEEIMKLKKTNAICALLTILLFLVHVIYIIVSYLTFSFDPFISKLIPYLAMGMVCLHAVLGMCAVFLQSDGSAAHLYPKQNLRTILQRVSAALIFPLLILHINTFNLLQSAASGGLWLLFGLVLTGQIFFYAVVLTHVSVSFTRAFITLGWLSDLNRQKRIDRVIYIIGAVLFAAASVIVIRTQLIMFGIGS